jgi:hypothetical protein
MATRKGQAIGGEQEAEQDAGTGRRRGGMLPPTGTGPVEVTPEWLAEQNLAAGQSTAAAVAVATGSLPEQQTAPLTALRLPDPDSSPADQLAMCERHIHSAKARLVAKVSKASDEFVDEAGPYLEWVVQHKLYKLMLDSSGKEYRSAKRYFKEQHDISPSTGYRITRTRPLLRILAQGSHPVPDLSVRQVQELHPVRTEHGHEAVLQVWRTALQTCKGALPTPDELAKAKVLRNLTTKPDDEEGEQPALTRAVDPGSVLAQAEKILVPDTVREAVQKDPGRVRMLVQILNTALSEAGMQVD